MNKWFPSVQYPVLKVPAAPFRAGSPSASAFGARKYFTPPSDPCQGLFSNSLKILRPPPSLEKQLVHNTCFPGECKGVFRMRDHLHVLRTIGHPRRRGVRGQGARARGGWGHGRDPVRRDGERTSRLQLRWKAGPRLPEACANRAPSPECRLTPPQVDGRSSASRINDRLNAADFERELLAKCEHGGITCEARPLAGQPREPYGVVGSLDHDSPDLPDEIRIDALGSAQRRRFAGLPPASPYPANQPTSPRATLMAPGCNAGPRELGDPAVLSQPSCRTADCVASLYIG